MMLPYPKDENCPKSILVKQLEKYLNAIREYRNLRKVTASELRDRVGVGLSKPLTVTQFRDMLLDLAARNRATLTVEHTVEGPLFTLKYQPKKQP